MIKSLLGFIFLMIFTLGFVTGIMGTSLVLLNLYFDFKPLSDFINSFPLRMWEQPVGLVLLMSVLMSRKER